MGSLAEQEVTFSQGGCSEGGPGTQAGWREHLPRRGGGWGWGQWPGSQGQTTAKCRPLLMFALPHGSCGNEARAGPQLANPGERERELPRDL